jgi:hypothetical protein
VRPSTACSPEKRSGERGPSARLWLAPSAARSRATDGDPPIR